MAVNVSTITSVCLYCKTNSEIEAEKDFHEIYDELGLELQLPTLVEKFFHITVRNDSKKYLCDDCVNRLIELYDLDEHTKKGSRKADDDLVISNIIKTGTEIVNKIEDYVNDDNTLIDSECVDKEKNDTCLETYTRKGTNEQPIHPNRLMQNDSLTVSNQSKKRHSQKREEETIVKYQSSKNVDVLLERSKYSFNQQDDNFLDDFVVRKENDVSLVINTTATSNSPTETTCSRDAECNEYIECVQDNGDQNTVIEITLNINNTDSFEEIDFSKENNLKREKKSDQNFEEENDTIDTDSRNSDQNIFMEIKELNEDSLINDNINSETSDKPEINIEEICIEEIENIYYEEGLTNEEKECTNEICGDMEYILSGNRSILNKAETINISFKTNEKENQFIVTEDIDIDQIIGDQDDVTNDTFCLDEEYLVEEISCSNEYDNIDLNDYLEKVIVTQFQDLSFNWKTECKLCKGNYNNFKELINHSCVNKFDEEEQFYCIMKNCNENINSLSTLARHLVLKHYDKLESISIYGKCTDCQKTFSNIIDFNKHSCCRNIKRKAGAPNYCQYCDMDFQSLKRYVFHMQFHLTNHRPKVCLLCGDIFNNPNDFFEHTQYHHISKTAMACIKCDRFFKEKDVFESHMELHEDSKYQYCCNLCPKKYTNKFGLNQHKDIYHNKKLNVLKCSHCEKEFVNKASYRNHLKSHATDVQVESFICSTCGIITNNTEFMKNHIESDIDSPCFSSTIEEKTLALGYTCENCSVDFLTIKQLKEHRLSKSHNDEIFQCVICRQGFKSLRHMRNHSINHKAFKEWQKTFPITRFFVCNIGNCQEFYPIWTSLYYHKKRPHKTKENSLSLNEFKCQFCHQLCSSKMSLAVHVARSHNNSNVKCSYCKRSFKSQKLLQEHIDKYHTPVECDVCFKKFKHRRNLESHKKLVHLNLKRYYCKYCEKGYFHKSEKDIHEKKVHPEVSYKCEICNFVTNYPNSLEIHMDKHNNQLKFKCTICNKAFGRKQLLQCHLKRHYNKKDYSCAKYLNESGCDAKFLTHNLLKRHIKSKHEQSTYTINMKNEEKRKKTSNQIRETVKIENISYQILDCDDDDDDDDDGSMTENSQNATLMHINDEDFEDDAYELVMENDI